jgi:hypothetical protein
LEKAKDPQKTEYKEVTIGLDITLKQSRRRSGCGRRWTGRKKRS